MIIWLDGICRAYCSFHRSDPVTCLNYILKLFEICINECLLSVYKRVQMKATNVLKVFHTLLFCVEIKTLVFLVDNYKNNLKTSNWYITFKSIIKRIISNSWTWFNICLYIIMELCSSFNWRYVWFNGKRLFWILSKCKK